jgi:hypothetical protein
MREEGGRGKAVAVRSKHWSSAAPHDRYQSSPSKASSPHLLSSSWNELAAASREAFEVALSSASPASTQQPSSESSRKLLAEPRTRSHTKEAPQGAAACGLPAALPFTFRPDPAVAVLPYAPLALVPPTAAAAGPLAWALAALAAPGADARLCRLGLPLRAAAGEKLTGPLLARPLLGDCGITHAARHFGARSFGSLALPPRLRSVSRTGSHLSGCRLF